MGTCTRHSLDVTLWEPCPLRGSSYHELPMWIKVKEAVINVMDIRQDCFKWAFLTGMHLVGKHEKKSKSYEQI